MMPPYVVARTSIPFGFRKVKSSTACPSAVLPNSERVTPCAIPVSVVEQAGSAIRSTAGVRNR